MHHEEQAQNIRIQIKSNVFEITKFYRIKFTSYRRDYFNDQKNNNNHTWLLALTKDTYKRQEERLQNGRKKIEVEILEVHPLCDSFTCSP